MPSEATVLGVVTMMYCVCGCELVGTVSPLLVASFPRGPVGRGS